MRKFVVLVFVLSCFVNVISLTSPFFMLSIYDRVLPSQSLPTLSALLILVVCLYLCGGILDVVRHRMLVRMSGIANASLSTRVFAAVSQMRLKLNVQADALKPAHEMDQIRGFVVGPGLSTLFDLPWMPLYLFVCFYIHPLIGWLTTGAMVLSGLLAVLADIRSRQLLKKASIALGARNSFGEAAHEGAETIAALRMGSRLTTKWNALELEHASLQAKAADLTGTLSSISKSLRMMLQSFTLALGAYLVMNKDMTGGMIIASSIIVARTIQPVEAAIAQWRSFIAAYQSWNKLKDVFALFPEEKLRTSLPPPTERFAVTDLFVGPPNSNRITAQNISFSAVSGTAIGVIGSSGSGKSSLARAIVGVWPTLRGEVCLDDAPLKKWPENEIGHHIGYLPQSIDFLPGTIGENIARFAIDASDSDIVSAAKEAGVHSLIMSLPDGYDTRLDGSKLQLSAGQQQRVALARALFGKPFLVVLDEPNSHADLEGDRALASAIVGIKERGGIAIIIAHRNTVLPVIDLLLVIENGHPKAFGKKDDVLRALNAERSSTQQQKAVETLRPERHIKTREVL